MIRTIVLSIAIVLLSVSSISRIAQAESERLLPLVKTSKANCGLGCQSVPDVAPYFKFGNSTATHIPSRKAKFIAWNLYKGKLKLFPTVFPQLIKDKDVILLSETVTGSDMMPTLTLNPNIGWHFSGSFIRDEGDWAGTMVGSEALAENVRVLRTTDLEPIVRTPKTVTLAEYKVENNNQNLLAISIHGMNWSGNDAIVKQVQDILPWIHAHKGPIIFAGDFNFKNKTRFELIRDILAREGMSPIPWENPNIKKQLDDGFSRGLTIDRAYLITEYVDKASDHPALVIEADINDLP